jgi:hypothetical protein
MKLKFVLPEKIDEIDDRECRISKTTAKQEKHCQMKNVHLSVSEMQSQKPSQFHSIGRVLFDRNHAFLDSQHSRRKSLIHAVMSTTDRSTIFQRIGTNL